MSLKKFLIGLQNEKNNIKLESSVDGWSNEEMLKFIEDNKYKATALSLIDSQDLEYIRIHS